MTSDINSSPNPDSQDPYVLLGLTPGAGFEEVQKAKAKRLQEVGDNEQAKAKIEASYDAVLMTSLKARQLGNVSNAAINASQREESNLKSGSGIKASTQSLMSGIGRFAPSFSSSNSQSQSLIPDIGLPEGQGLTIRLFIGLSALLLLIFSPAESVELILSLSTILLFISLIKRGIRPLQSLGWSVVSLSVGLIIGGIVQSSFGIEIAQFTNLVGDQIQAIPAIILLWICSLFFS